MKIPFKYRLKLISINPNEIIPFHNIYSFKFGIFCDYLAGVYIPPIPIIKAPSDLKEFGNYVNYNGHHRTLAARKVVAIKKDFRVSCILLENWQDICYLRDNPPEYKGEIYPELIEGLENTFEAHRDFIWNEARRFKKLEEIANQKFGNK
jgi:sarcosine oxidase delta subunit